jgi:hypothetical protein
VLDPVQGKWLQRDPAGFVDGGSVYLYAGGSPTARMDPSGNKYVVRTNMKPLRRSYSASTSAGGSASISWHAWKADASSWIDPADYAQNPPTSLTVRWNIWADVDYHFVSSKTMVERVSAQQDARLSGSIGISCHSEAVQAEWGGTLISDIKHNSVLYHKTGVAYAAVQNSYAARTSAANGRAYIAEVQYRSFYSVGIGVSLQIGAGAGVGPVKGTISLDKWTLFSPDVVGDSGTRSYGVWEFWCVCED